MSDENKPSGAQSPSKKMTSGQPQEGLWNSLCFSTSKRAYPNNALHFLYQFVGLFVCLCVCNYRVCNNYVTYIVAMPCNFTLVDLTAALSTVVANMYEWSNTAMN